MTTNNERVADTSKTIDHIADVSKKVSLKELWRRRELDGAYYIKNGNGEYEVQIFQDKRKDYRFIGSPISEFVCEVPDYIEWRNMVNCACYEHEYNLKLLEENDKFKELLKRARDSLEGVRCCVAEQLTYEIDETLKNK